MWNAPCRYCKWGLLPKRYEPSCEEHDEDYGRDKPRDRTRKEADKAFKENMLILDNTLPGVFWANLATIGIRSFGWIWWTEVT